ncbi:MAG TPA: glucosamine-6-phosphate deaminase [Chryseosolibacter sp.]|nr:glucosamine-6-phosphate deaminase [Chryseosolibacter sp.]
MQQLQADTLTVRVYENRALLGADAARMAATTLRDLLSEKDVVNIIFAAAPSQNEFLATLAAEEDIDWQRVRAFHMDEYIGLAPDAVQRFGNFLRTKFFDRVPLREVHYLMGEAEDPEAECRRYAELLLQYPPHIVFMGIGENTHIAFNDPHVAHFDDPHLVKIVDLDEACRQQQVNDGCFKTLHDVPRHALTLTVPALMKAEQIFCMVPAKTKAQAIFRTLTEAITERYPSTILRTHPNATLFIDKDSAALLR